MEVFLFARVADRVLDFSHNFRLVCDFVALLRRHSFPPFHVFPPRKARNGAQSCPSRRDRYKTHEILAILFYGEGCRDRWE